MTDEPDVLSVVADRRSGRQLEVVVPTRNEAGRIAGVVDYYRRYADVVLLDLSSDGTAAVAVERGASVFRRVGDADVQPERHFAHYANHVSKSGRCVFLHADELVGPGDLDVVARALESGRLVMGERIDYIYGHRVHAPGGCTPRGFVRGRAAYDPTRFHGSLRAEPAAGDPGSVTVPILHLHIWDVSRVFGRAGEYVREEVRRIAGARAWRRAFVRRFVVSPVIYFTLKSWRERHGIGLFFGLMRLSDLPIAVLCLLEMRWFKSPEEQVAQYAGFYARGSAGRPTSE
jgi:hypothetical protein